MALVSFFKTQKKGGIFWKHVLEIVMTKKCGKIRRSIFLSEDEPSGARDNT